MIVYRGLCCKAVYSYLLKYSIIMRIGRNAMLLFYAIRCSGLPFFPSLLKWKINISYLPLMFDVF